MHFVFLPSSHLAQKDGTARVATASGLVVLGREAYRLVMANEIKKVRTRSCCIRITCSHTSCHPRRYGCCSPLTIAVSPYLPGLFCVGRCTQRCADCWDHGCQGHQPAHPSVPQHLHQVGSNECKALARLY